MSDPQFTPQVTLEEATKLSSDYDSAADGSALEAGQKIKSGDYSRIHLETIFKWKTKNRGKSRLARNTDSEIADALWLAATAKEPRSAIAVLTGLSGVDTPVASAIATVIHPDTHTILDFRALETLGNRSPDRSMTFYLNYLAFCTNLAAEWKMSLRQLDRALWQWSADRSVSAHAKKSILN